MEQCIRLDLEVDHPDLERDQQTLDPIESFIKVKPLLVPPGESYVALSNPVMNKGFQVCIELTNANKQITCY